ncbi:uncharacterized protein [Eleutherodactylus coqui]
MWTILCCAAALGVFLQTTSGQKWDIKKMEECSCANDVIEAFLESVAKSDAESFNGQKLRLTLWQSTNDKCTAHVLDKSPKPGRIEISMLYHASVHNEEQEEGEVQQQELSDNGQEQGGAGLGQEQEGDDIGQEQEGDDIGQQQASEDTEPQEEVDMEQGQTEEYIELQQVDMVEEQTDGDIDPQQEVDMGQEQTDGDIDPQQEVDMGQEQVAEQLLDNLVMEQMKQSMATGQLQQNPDLGQQQEGAGAAQEQPNQSNDSHSETGGEKKDYKAQYTFILDVNTGKLSDSADSATRTQRRRRELMPFDSVSIKMELNVEEPASADGTTSDRIRPLLRKGLADYWLKMTNCLLDVKE